MSPRTGRPPINNPKNVKLNIRITEETAQILQRCAEELGVTKTDVITKGIKMVEADIKRQK